MAAPTLSGLDLDSAAAGFVEQQRQFRESVHAMYGHKDLSGDIISHSVSGSIKLIDALALVRSVQVARPAKILEVGSFLGFSTRVLLDASAEFGAQVTSLDPRIRHRIFDDIKTHVTTFNESDRLTCRDAFFCRPLLDGMYHDYLNYEPALTREEADAILNGIEVVEEPFDMFDFAFIDGDHSYIATVENLVLAAQMVQPGSLIVLHDAISWPDVVPAATSVADEIDGLSVVGVAGAAERDFFIDWWGKLGSTDENGGELWNLAGSICDGLCILKVDEGVDQVEFASRCSGFTRAHLGAFERARQFQTEREQANLQRDQLAGERDHLVQERDHLLHERDRLAHERDQLDAQRDALQSDRDRVEHHNHQLNEENAQLDREADQLARRCNQLELENQGLRRPTSDPTYADLRFDRQAGLGPGGPRGLEDRVAERLRRN